MSDTYELSDTEKREVELVWNGKTRERGLRRERGHLADATAQSGA